MIGWWQRRSLRFRLAAWYATGGTLLLIAFSATIYLYVANSLARPIDHQLRRDLQIVREHLSFSSAGLMLWDSREFAPGAPWNPGNPWFELWDEQGRLVHRAWSLAEENAGTLRTAPVPGREAVSILTLNPALRVRTLSLPYAYPGIAEGWTIRVFHIHTPVADTLNALLGIIAIALPAVVTVLVFGGYALTRRWLKPLDLMASEAGHISASDLGRRLPVANPHDELGRLATVFNLTLDRLENAFRDLDRFVGDAAHELRRPLTALRNVGEVGLLRERTAAEYRDIIGSMLEEQHRIQALVNRLLELAGAESGGILGHKNPVWINELVAQCVDEFSLIAEPRGQQIELDSVPAPAVTDPVILQQAVRNLLDNALKYSPDGSTVRLSIRDEGDVWRIAVVDAGPGISPEHRARLAERFFRAGRSSDKTRPGFGLGLSITRVYMRVLRGALHYERLESGGSRFSLTLPKDDVGTVPSTPTQV
ncbi:MAG TPA: ATP-binding protein [Opitutaceae bacterium]